MAEERTEADSPRARLFRSVEELPFRPLWLGAAVALGLEALLIGYHLLFGVGDAVLLRGGPLGLAPDGINHTVLCILTGFVVAVRRHDARQFRTELLELHPLTRGSRSELAALLDRAAATSPASRLAFVVCGALLGLVMASGGSSDPGYVLRPAEWNAHLLWVLLSNCLLFGLMGRSLQSQIVARRVHRTLEPRLERIDLLDPRPMAPLARQGLRHAFYWAGGSSIASLLAFNIPRGWPLFTVISLTLILATVALIGPALGIHRRIRDARQAELELVRRRIMEAKDASLAARPVAAVDPLPGLIAYEARIERVNAWPFDVPTLVRFGAVLALVIGSWLGGALVERLLGLVLD